MAKGAAGSVVALGLVGVILYAMRGQLKGLFSSAQTVPVGTSTQGFPFVGVPTALSPLGTPGSYFNTLAGLFGSNPGTLEASAIESQAAGLSSTPYVLTDANGNPIPGVT